ncbi:MAG: hypothetical protein Q9187_007544, partial [Circinaria calcarea]
PEFNEDTKMRDFTPSSLRLIYILKESGYDSNPGTLLISRRATTAAAKRRLRFGDAFTFFYSSILATAAVTDAKRKDDKIKDWDRAIGEAKEELKAIEAEQERRLQALSKPNKLDCLGDWKKTEPWETVFDWAGHQNQARAALGYGKLQGIHASVLNGLSPANLGKLCRNGGIMEAVEGRPEQDVGKETSTRGPLSTKKRKTIELSTAKMIFRLLQSCKGTPPNSATLNSSERLMQQALMRNRDQLRSKLAEMEDRLSQLRRLDAHSESLHNLESPRLPVYSEDISTTAESSPSLNATLETLLGLNQREIYDIHALVTKICYNLLVSTTPPNVHTYNMLIIRLCHLHQLKMASIVLDSMRECHIRPNEATVAATLRYHTFANDRVGFRAYVNRMQGKGGGLHLANPLTPITSVNQTRYVAERAGIIHYNVSPGTSTHRTGNALSSTQMKIIEKAPRNQDVFSALIIGSLKLFGLDAAMPHYLDMVRCGWDTDTQILAALLKHCSYTKNWLFGQKIWQEIQRLASSATEIAYFWMLRLCLICRREEEFESVLRDGIESNVLDSSLTQISFSVSRKSLKIVMSKGSKRRREHIERLTHKLEKNIERIGFGSYDLAKEVHEIETRIHYGPSVALMIAHRLKLCNRGGPADSGAKERRELRALLHAKAVELELTPSVEMVPDAALANSEPKPHGSEARTSNSITSLAVVPHTKPQAIQIWDQPRDGQLNPATVSTGSPSWVEGGRCGNWEQSLAAA